MALHKAATSEYIGITHETETYTCQFIIGQH